ncbi:MAG: FprA family A-type flavoprotein, partial [Lachnospiraceae bacterium]|nr:FprA family A-type flavoprotein [Lachnospiraceae bacterium]
MTEKVKERTMISEGIRYVGFDDTELEIFESQYPTEGISYNSYVILDDRTAIMDTVDKRGTEAYFENLKEVLGDRRPSYLVIQHMEPDHAANIEKLANMYPDMQLVGSAAAGRMLSQFFEGDMQGRFKAVKENDTLDLGNHVLKFLMAPMVHWPEVMVTYAQTEKVLFSADAFGTFGALENDEEWIADASHYYFNIVGKYGAQVQALLKKASGLDISVIAPLHGPVHKEDIQFVIETYDKWSSYEPARKGIFIPFASIHGNTKEAVLRFAKELESMGETVVTMDLTKEDVSEAVEQAFLYDRIIFASATYDLEIFPVMNDLLHHLKIKNFQKRRVGLIENGSWAPAAAKKMREYLEGMKDIEIVDPVITIKSVRKASDDAAFKALAEA